jgi:hypothetical protein
MHPRERLLGEAKLLRKRRQPIPLDLLVKADELGISLEVLGENTNLNHLTEEGEVEYVETEDHIHNNQRDSSIPLVKHT